ncbi:TPA: hypothetical protein DCW38_04990 [candidate division WOR-3 bacterium]|jgi:uncharacterized protein YjbI with pentapeptide repeats|uniref:Potassium channel domain-containing protein n=1 Tax=candidate division WOR-3 bacterium TaxID=2052148 RepID=A0A350HAF4_UNCW3|nr:hypothetical protein [candidate division WOR-3 bacterium]
MTVIRELEHKRESLVRRWKEISKTNKDMTEDIVKRNIVGIIGTSEDWKIQLSDFLRKINLPITDSSTEESITVNGERVKVNLDLRGIDLSNERFTARRFNEFAYARNTAKHSSSIGDMSGLHFEYAVLDNTHFEGIDISNSCFDFSSLQNCIFKHSKCINDSFIGADCCKILFENADLNESAFIFSDMRGAEIVASEIEGCDFTGAKFFQAKLVSNSCDVSTKFISEKVYYIKDNEYTILSIRGKEILIDSEKTPVCVLRENLDEDDRRWRTTKRYAMVLDEYNEKNDEDDWSEIKEIYRQIKLMYRSHGFYSEGDTYFFLELKAKRKSHASVIYRSFMKAIEFLTGYGIKIERMVILALTTVGFFSCIYAFDSSNLVSSDSVMNMSFKELISRSIYFSIVTFTTVGYGDIHPIGYMRFVANFEAFCGLLVMGLFVVSITRKFIGD